MTEYAARYVTTETLTECATPQGQAESSDMVVFDLDSITPGGPNEIATPVSLPNGPASETYVFDVASDGSTVFFASTLGVYETSVSNLLNASSANVSFSPVSGLAGPGLNQNPALASASSRDHVWSIAVTPSGPFMGTLVASVFGDGLRIRSPGVSGTTRRITRASSSFALPGQYLRYTSNYIPSVALLPDATTISGFRLWAESLRGVATSPLEVADRRDYDVHGVGGIGMDAEGMASNRVTSVATITSPSNPNQIVGTIATHAEEFALPPPPTHGTPPSGIGQSITGPHRLSYRASGSQAYSVVPILINNAPVALGGAAWTVLQVPGTQTVLTGTSTGVYFTNNFFAPAPGPTWGRATGIPAGRTVLHLNARTLPNGSPQVMALTVDTSGSAMGSGRLYVGAPTSSGSSSSWAFNEVILNRTDSSGLAFGGSRVPTKSIMLNASQMLVIYKRND